MAQLERTEGRRAFGHDPQGYLDARPDYPAELYRILIDRCGLGPGTRTLEIGPGPGLATRRLIELGASPLTLVEPDPRLAKFLADELGAQPSIEIQVAAFEDAALPESAYDLAVCASAFHWVDEERGLEKVSRLLRPGGWWAMWWNTFGTADDGDAFHVATRSLLRALERSPAVGSSVRPQYALDVEARTAAIRSVAGFTDISYELLRWKAVYDAEKLRALYATFSPIALLDPEERDRVLDAVQSIAERDFDGSVERQILTPVYLARKTGEFE
ncbi:MAG TPA: class I SAM-dependent methyltransferase [Blastocatellia bacterium]|nr:class I SAM-dependent methyltransferase [Blastocatellia bacterium]